MLEDLKEIGNRFLRDRFRRDEGKRERVGNFEVVS